MRKFSYILAAVMLLTLANLSAAETVKPKPAKSLAKQIKELIGHDAIKVKDKDLKGRILFTLNQDQEIVVLVVEADTKEMEAYIKNRINNKKVAVGDWVQGKKYVLPVLVTS